MDIFGKCSSWERFLKIPQNYTARWPGEFPDALRDSGCSAFADHLSATGHESRAARTNRVSALINKIRKLILLIPAATDFLLSCESLPMTHCALKKMTVLLFA